jgi:hypothetical protein
MIVARVPSPTSIRRKVRPLQAPQDGLIVRREFDEVFAGLVIGSVECEGVAGQKAGKSRGDKGEGADHGITSSVIVVGAACFCGNTFSITNIVISSTGIGCLLWIAWYRIRDGAEIAAADDRQYRLPP